MQFTPAVNDTYKTMNDPKQPDASVLVASGAKSASNWRSRFPGKAFCQQRGQNGEEQGEARRKTKTVPAEASASD